MIPSKLWYLRKTHTSRKMTVGEWGQTSSQLNNHFEKLDHFQESSPNGNHVTFRGVHTNPTRDKDEKWSRACWAVQFLTTWSGSVDPVLMTRGQIERLKEYYTASGKVHSQHQHQELWTRHQHNVSRFLYIQKSFHQVSKIFFFLFNEPS